MYVHGIVDLNNGFKIDFLHLKFFNTPVPYSKMVNVNSINSESLVYALRVFQKAAHVFLLRNEKYNYNRAGSFTRDLERRFFSIHRYELVRILTSLHGNRHGVLA